MHVIRKISHKEENFRLENITPNVKFARRDPVEPVPVGTIVAMMFRVTGYDQDADGSLMARLEQVEKDGSGTGWETDAIGLYPNSTVVLDTPGELHEFAETLQDGPA